MITDNQKKRLENAGYRLSKNGTTVLTKDGASIGGINANGNVWSGSDTVAKILKGSGEKPTSTKSGTPKKPTGRRTAAKSEPKAPTQSKRPKQRQMGRGEPNYGEPTKTTPMGGPRRGRKPVKSRTKVPTNQPIPPRAYTQEEAQNQLDKQRKVQTPKETKPTFKEFMNSKRREDRNAFRSDPSGFTERMRSLYEEKFGFNKGGMVKSGNKDYKKSGMFYKSGSPRGYK